MSTIPTTEPTRFISGDTVNWSVYHADYLSTDGWSIGYTFVRAGLKKAVTTVGQADGSHLAAIAAADSGWGAGTFSWQKHATKGPERRTFESGQTAVEADFATATGGLDARPHAEKALEAIEAVLEKRASTHHESYSIDTDEGSRAVRNVPRGELMVIRDRYRAEVRALRNAERIAQGHGASKILVRMGGL